MNFALDALWWRLSNPQVRDLASILFAPPLWQTGCELPVRDLVGEHGFRYLLDLNDNPDFRLPEDCAHPLLGKYAENVLAFWLANAPHCRLLARNVPLFNQQNQSIGELDFIAEIHGRLYHIELACKYFGATDGQPENMVGLNHSDTLLNKISKLSQQLNTHLPSEWQTAQRVSVVRGMAFSHSGSLQIGDVFAPNTWAGRLISDWECDDFQEKFWYRLPKNGLLSPARVSGSLKMTAADVGHDDGLVAELALRPDGYWHEIQRFMLKK